MKPAELTFPDPNVVTPPTTAPAIHPDGLLFRCDEAACHLDARFYESFDMDERWAIIRTILDAALIPPLLCVTPRPLSHSQS